MKTYVISYRCSNPFAFYKGEKIVKHYTLDDAKQQAYNELTRSLGKGLLIEILEAKEYESKN